MIKTNIFQPKLLSKAIALASLPLFAFCTSSVLAQENSDLVELRQLQDRMEKLEKRLQDAVSTAPSISSDTSDNKYIVRDGKGIKIGDTTISFGGFIKTDLIYGSGGNGTRNGYSIGLARTYANAANSKNNSWNVGLTARESRFSIGTKTENVAGHDLTTYLEMDFNQSDDMVGSNGNETVSNSYSPRLRQAVASWNNWDVGQTYSTFTDLAVMPEILGQGKQAAFMYVTQPMVRYNMAVPGGGKLLVALENPEDGFTGQPDSYDDQSYPDLTARYQINGKYGYYSVSGVARKLEHKKDSKTTGAISLSARFPTIGKDDLRLQYSYGAIGRYMGLYTYPDLDLAKQKNGKVDPLKTFGATAAYRHYWSDDWRSTLTASHTEVVNSLLKQDAGNGTLSYFDTSSSVHANLMWSAHKNLTLGIEYAYWDFGKITGGSKQYEQIMTSAILNF